RPETGRGATPPAPRRPRPARSRRPSGRRRRRGRAGTSFQGAEDVRVALVRREGRRLGEGHPAHLVDLVLRHGLTARLHPVVPHLFGTAALIGVVGAPHLGAGVAAEPGLLLDLAPRALLPRLARIELALGQRPVVVARPVDEQDVAVADDDAARGANLRHTSSSSASPCPPPEQIAASPSPPPSRRSSCTRVPTIRPPEAPTGWPSATAPPFTFTRSSSAPRSRVECFATEEKASLISTRATSSIDLPALPSAIADA